MYLSLQLQENPPPTFQYAQYELSEIFSQGRTIFPPQTFGVTNEQLDMAVKILCAKISPSQKRVDPKGVERLNAPIENKAVDAYRASSSTLTVVGGSRVELFWLGPFRHISRDLSFISRALTRNPLLPLLAFLSQISFTNALPEAPSELSSFLQVPLSPYDLASTLFITLIYTSAIALISFRLETRTQYFGLFALLELLAYVSSFGVYDAQGGQEMWQLSLFL